MFEVVERFHNFRRSCEYFRKNCRVKNLVNFLIMTCKSTWAHQEDLKINSERGRRFHGEPQTARISIFVHWMQLWIMHSPTVGLGLMHSLVSCIPSNEGPGQLYTWKRKKMLLHRVFSFLKSSPPSSTTHKPLFENSEMIYEYDYRLRVKFG